MHVNLHMIIDSQIETCVLEHFGRETSVVTESASRENIH